MTLREQIQVGTVTLAGFVIGCLRAPFRAVEILFKVDGPIEEYELDPDYYLSTEDSTLKTQPPASFKSTLKNIGLFFLSLGEALYSAFSALICTPFEVAQDWNKTEKEFIKKHPKDALFTWPKIKMFSWGIVKAPYEGLKSAFTIHFTIQKGESFFRALLYFPLRLIEGFLGSPFKAAATPWNSSTYESMSNLDFSYNENFATAVNSVDGDYDGGLRQEGESNFWPLNQANTISKTLGNS